LVRHGRAIRIGQAPDLEAGNSAQTERTMMDYTLMDLALAGIAVAGLVAVWYERRQERRERMKLYQQRLGQLE